MIYRARAPLRLGLAGGGTDVSPFCDLYGGAILNATISLFAHAIIEPRQDGKVVFLAMDLAREVDWVPGVSGPVGDLPLHQGVVDRLVRDFGIAPQGFTLITSVDAPPGSGLGSSSALVTAILGVLCEAFSIALGEYEIAHLAFEIERLDLGMAGGRQDQYAACFGGFNYMEFFNNDKVVVNPLRVRGEAMRELESCLLLFDMGTSRISSEIIENQRRAVTSGKQDSLEAMQALKQQAVQMKEALLTGRLHQIGGILDYGWLHKKEMSEGISNPIIDQIYETARSAGSSGGKVSGAGGGGHIIFFCPGRTAYSVRKALSSFGGTFRPFVFNSEGLLSWRVG